MKIPFRLELVAFITGFALMAYELVAARMLAPSIGSSTYVWTSVIGIIIAALSLGYWQGGRLADARHRAHDIAWLILLTAATIVWTKLAFTWILDWTIDSFADPRWQAVVAATVLFAPASFVLGAISPYLAKLNVRSLERAGQAVASLGALNSVGGIVGTFVTGFWLFGYIGSRETLIIIVLMLIATSWLMAPRERVVERIIASVVLAVLLLIPATQSNSIAIDTPSAHYEVTEFVTEDDRTLRGLVTGPSGIQSGVYVGESEELPFWYTREMVRLALAEQPESILMLGGGAFTIPEYLAGRLPDTQIDVVEIDPELEAISVEHFGYSHPKNVNLIFEDARAFVEGADQTYDMILVDVYGDSEIPFTLMTAEYGQHLAKLLHDDGMVVVNLIAGTTPGPCRAMLASFDQVYRQEMPYAHYATARNEELVRGNHIVVYTKDDRVVEGLRELPAYEGRLYTDNYAPTERLYFECTDYVRYM